jgi:hypothetical protein
MKRLLTLLAMLTALTIGVAGCGRASSPKEAPPARSLEEMGKTPPPNSPGGPVAPAPAASQK